MEPTSKLPLILERDGAHLLKAWMAELSAANNGRLISPDGLTEQARELLNALQQAVQQGNLEEIQGPHWARVREVLSEISRTQTKRSEEHTSELQSRFDLVCRLLLEKKKEKY